MSVLVYKGTSFISEVEDDIDLTDVLEDLLNKELKIRIGISSVSLEGIIGDPHEEKIKIKYTDYTENTFNDHELDILQLIGITFENGNYIKEFLDLSFIFK